jgi:hypothetical protein
MNAVAMTTPQVAASQTLREALIKEHGEVMGHVLADAEIRRRRETADKFQKLRGQLDTLQVRSDALMSAGNARLAPLEAAMNAAHELWMRACLAYEQQCVLNQSEQLPLQNEMALLVEQINSPAHGSRVKAWTAAPQNGGRYSEEF